MRGPCLDVVRSWCSYPFFSSGRRVLRVSRYLRYRRSRLCDSNHICTHRGIKGSSSVIAVVFGGVVVDGDLRFRRGYLCMSWACSVACPDGSAVVWNSHNFCGAGSSPPYKGVCVEIHLWDSTGTFSTRFLPKYLIWEFSCCEPCCTALVRRGWWLCNAEG